MKTGERGLSMNVQDTVDLGDGHRIEFGQGTWNLTDTSVRDRYPTRTGGFSPHSSSEVPIHDVGPIAVEALRRDLLISEETMQILQAAVDSIRLR